MVQRYISHSISNTLHYSSEIHPYVGEFHYLCKIVKQKGFPFPYPHKENFFFTIMYKPYLISGWNYAAT